MHLLWLTSLVYLLSAVSVPYPVEDMQASQNSRVTITD